MKKVKKPCAKCAYKLGLVKTLVNPCPACEENDYKNIYKLPNPFKGRKKK